MVIYPYYSSLVDTSKFFWIQIRQKRRPWCAYDYEWNSFFFIMSFLKQLNAITFLRMNFWSNWFHFSKVQSLHSLLTISFQLSSLILLVYILVPLTWIQNLTSDHTTLPLLSLFLHHLTSFHWSSTFHIVVTTIQSSQTYIHTCLSYRTRLISYFLLLTSDFIAHCFYFSFHFLHQPLAIFTCISFISFINHMTTMNIPQKQTHSSFSIISCPHLIASLSTSFFLSGIPMGEQYSFSSHFSIPPMGEQSSFWLSATQSRVLLWGHVVKVIRG